MSPIFKFPFPLVVLIGFVVYCAIGLGIMLGRDYLVQAGVCTGIPSCVYALADPETYPIFRGLFSGYDASVRTVALVLMLALAAATACGAYRALRVIAWWVLRKVRRALRPSASHL